MAIFHTFQLFITCTHGQLQFLTTYSNNILIPSVLVSRLITKRHSHCNSTVLCFLAFWPLILYPTNHFLNGEVFIYMFLLQYSIISVEFQQRRKLKNCSLAIFCQFICCFQLRPSPWYAPTHAMLPRSTTSLQTGWIAQCSLCLLKSNFRQHGIQRASIFLKLQRSTLKYKK